MVASSMSIGLHLPTAPPLALNRLLVCIARLSRLDAVWAVDHWQGPFPTDMAKHEFPWAATICESPHAFFDYQVLLGSLAKSAGRLHLGVGVTDPIRRHPLLIAQAMLTLAHLTKRRPILGIGAGERENIEPYGLDFSAPVSRLEEALQIIRLCFSHKGPIDFYGKYYHLERALMDLRAPKGRTPEIWIGGQGPRMLQLTGQYGDGWYPSAIVSPEEYAAKLKAVQEAASLAGRDPQAVTPALLQPLVVASTEQQVRQILDSKLGRIFALQTAAAGWRKFGAQHPFGEHFRGGVDWDPEHYDPKMFEEALAAVPPELIGYGLLLGTPEQVAGKLRAFGEVGVRHVGLLPISMIVSRAAAIYGLWAVRRIARLVRNTGSG